MYAEHLPFVNLFKERISNQVTILVTQSILLKVVFIHLQIKSVIDKFYLPDQIFKLLITKTTYQSTKR